jgi:hypothetical protein
VTDAVSRASLAAVTLLVFSRAAAGQAWVPPAGIGSVSVTYQVVDNAGHLLTDGSLLGDGKSTNMAAGIEAEYAITDRLSVSGGLPFVSAKYRGPGPTPFVFLPVDSCHCWHSGFQDFTFGARYNIVNGTFGLTPSVAVGLPSHDYDFRGEATLGTHLKELRVGIDAGQRLDVISPKLSVQARYGYTIVERPLGIAHNRSNATFEGGYLIRRRLSARGWLSIQRTHGGLRLGAGPDSGLLFPGDVRTPELQFQHDRLLRDNNWRAGAGFAYSLPSFDVFGSYLDYVAGTDAHADHVFTVGVSWPFEIDRPSKQP